MRISDRNCPGLDRHCAYFIHGGFWRGLTAMGAFLALLFAGGAAAADVPPLTEIAPSVAAAHPELVKQRAALRKEREEMRDTAKRHNQQCSAVEPESADEQRCTQSLATLTASANHHIEASKAFNEKIRLTLSHAAPHTDTSVVDARGAKDGAYLTAQVPELARSPAADRISKGFQAVINHDWPVALAWWQDALQRDPGNGALKRSVDLAQWMVDRRKAVAAGPVTPLSAAIHAAGRGDNAQAIRQLELVKAQSPDSAAHVDSMIATIQKQSAQKEKQAAISAEIAKQQISLVGELNDEGLKMLIVGKNKEAQKLFEDAQFFSMGLSPKQVKSYASSYLGPVSAAPNQSMPMPTK